MYPNHLTIGCIWIIIFTETTALNYLIAWYLKDMKKRYDTMRASEFLGKEKIGRILLKTAPPVMISQLIQALYNIVDSLFVGKYSESGLTALSIIFPIQLLMIALAMGCGVGLNTLMASRSGVGRSDEAKSLAGVGTPLAIALWAVFATVCWFIMPAYARASTGSATVINDVVVYGRIVCVFSIGLFLESMWTNAIQSFGDMKTPMAAQISGAVTNIILDPLLIFGLFGLPKMGMAGAAVATVTGQMVAALVVFKKGFFRSPPLSVYAGHIKMIFLAGLPGILMRSAYTLYIFGLNLILATFSDEAVTVLGLYYKWQTFFIIPLTAMQTCIVPIVSYNYAAGNYKRCKKTLNISVIFGCGVMLLGTLCFAFIPRQMLGLFSSDPAVIDIGGRAFPIIGLCYVPIVTSLIFPVFFQAVGQGVKSSLLTVIRTVFLFVPLGYLFSLIGLDYFWLTFPVTDTVTSIIGGGFYLAFCKRTDKKKVGILKSEICK